MHSDRKGLRDRAAAKAKRLANNSPGKVDASSWTPDSTPVSSDNQTGMKPISRRAFKRGGKVASMEGSKAKANMGRKPRKGGGMTVDDYVNRDMKMANDKLGNTNVGAMKKGGKVHDDVVEDKKLIKSMIRSSAMKKADGGQTVNRAGKGDYAGDYPSDMNAEMAAKIRAAQAAQDKKEKQWENTTAVGKKSGGKVHPKSCGCKMCSGGRTKKAGGGSTEDALKAAGMVGAMGGGLLPMGIAALMGAKKKDGGKVHPKSCKCKACCGGGRVMKAGGGKASGEDVGEGPRGMKVSDDLMQNMKSQFKSGLDAGTDPMEMAYKMMMGSGKGTGPSGSAMSFMNSISQKKPSSSPMPYTSPAAARKSGGRTARKHGGKVNKGKTNIHINIDTKPASPGPGPGPMPMPPALMGRPPAPPMGPPPGGGGIPPQVLAALAGAGRPPGGMPGGVPGMPPRPFKRGGKVYSSYKDMDVGSGSGEGRLEKSEIAAKSNR